jgi:hypothetical protein
LGDKILKFRTPAEMVLLYVQVFTLIVDIGMLLLRLEQLKGLRTKSKNQFMVYPREPSKWVSVEHPGKWALDILI